MIAIIRIKGRVKIDEEIENTFKRLRLRKKYSCVIVREKPEILGMIKKLRNFVAYGNIDKNTLKELIEKRGKFKAGEKEIKGENIVEKLLEKGKERKLEDFGLKPYFRLHPPRGGIKSKEHYPRGILGNNKEKINDLIRRML